MSVGITVRDDIHALWKLEQNVDNLTSLSFSEWIDEIRCERDNLLKEINNLQETTVTQEGRISKTLAGKTILYRIKEPNAISNTTTEET